MIASYSDAGQSPPQFAGSLLAHGTLDNVQLVLPDPPLGPLGTPIRTQEQWAIPFQSNTNWNYQLDRSTDLKLWTTLRGFVPGTGNFLWLVDTNAMGEKAFYRVRAERR